MRMLMSGALILCLLQGAAAQPGPQPLWTRTFGGIYDDVAEVALPTGDGGFIFGGGNASIHGGNGDMWLVKVDGEGNPQWDRTYGGPDFEYGQSLIPTNDGGYLLAGVTRSYGAGGEDAWVVKTDAVGNPQWNRAYGGPGDERAYCACQMGDGGFAIAGYTSSAMNGHDVYLVRTDAQGQPLWTRRWGEGGDDDAAQVRETSDHGLLLAGHTASLGAGDWDFFVVRTNAQGEDVWIRTYGGHDRDFAMGLDLTEDGGFVVAGVTNSVGAGWSDAYVVKVNAAGETEWARPYGGPYSDAAIDVRQCPGGYFAAALTRHQVSGPNNGWMFRIGPQGEMLWSTEVGGGGDDWLLHAMPTPDGGWIVSGFTTSLGAGGRDAYLLRMPSEHPQPEHHFLPVPPTGLPYAVIVDSAQIDSRSLLRGDEIAVFDGLLCVGVAAVGESWPVALTAWQGDSAHGLAGFVPGHVMSFRVWLREPDVDVPAVPTITVGDGLFGTGVYTELSLSGNATATQTIPLQPQYADLISFNVRPSDASAANIFGALPSLVAVYDDEGGVFIPPAVNTLGELRFPEGYRVYCMQAETLRVSGIPLSPATEYELPPGRWNWISYPLPDAVPVESALASIAAHLTIIQNDNGQVWIPALNINTLGQLVPGDGYMAIVDQAVRFRFGAGPGKQGSSDVMIRVMGTLPGAPRPTGLPYAVVVRTTPTLRDLGPQVIELYDGPLCVGKSRVDANRDFSVVTAWQAVPDLQLPGFTPSREIVLKMKDASGVEIATRLTGASRTYASGAYADLTVETSASAASFRLSEGYPNPFNASVTFTFDLPEAGPVEFTVFNAIGQAVAQPTQTYAAGEHRFTFDARSGGSELVSGIYFVQARYGGSTVIRKVVLLK